jgi:hypothetical protein
MSISVVTSTSAPGENRSAAQSSPMPSTTPCPLAARARIQAIKPNSPAVAGSEWGFDMDINNLKNI